jgi:molecular chaperone GrpE
VTDEAPFDTPLEPETVAAAEAGDLLSEAERQRDEYLDALQRVQADFENYRKRVARASEEAAARATGDLVARLLPVLDAFDLAQAHFSAGGEISEEAIALTQARGLMLDTLGREGLERIDADGVAFDPQVHDAVAHEPGEGEPVIDGVLRAGYRWKGSVLRPAMVRVKG